MRISHRGFTLVEILIVMSMVGILASFMFPSLTPYVSRGRDSSRVADIKTIQTYLKTYEIDTGKYIDHTNGCVPYTTLQSAGYTTTLPRSPSGDLYDEGCGSNGQYAYGTSTGLLIGHRVSLLMSHMERESGGNYSGSTSGMTGDITPIGYLLMNTTEKGSGPWYLMLDSGDTSGSGSSVSGSSGSGTAIPDIDGGWSPWGPTLTGSCSTTCGPGTASLVQLRSCTNPTPSGSGANCTGSSSQTVGSQACNMGTCNTNGVCDNSTQFTCTSGTPVSNIDNYTGPSCGGTSTWGCNGSGTGTSTSPTACSRVNPVCNINGVCGGIANTCTVGSPSGYSAGSCGGSQTWSCDGSGTGTTASCSIVNPVCIDGSCNAPFNSATTPTPTCASGTPTSVSGTGPWTWGCNSTNGGTNTAPNACTANKIVDCVGSWGSCSNGSQTYTITTPAANGGTACIAANGATQSCGTPASCNAPFNSATTPTPTCASGTPTSVSGTGPWTWGCNSTNGGINTASNACTANKTVDCVGSWGSCSNGSQTYTITTPAANGGVACTTANGATQSCGTPASCNNSVQFSCSSGNSVFNVTNYTGSSCGGTSTWGCNSIDGGTNTTSLACSKVNPSCIAAPIVSSTTLAGGMISWSWTSVPSATSYEWSIDSGYTSSTQPGTIVNISLSCNTLHNLKVRACIGASCSDWSIISNQMSPPCPPSSATPGSTTLTSISSSWTASPGSNYYRYWNTTANRIVFRNTTNYTDSSLSCGTGYDIYIQGCVTNSDYSCGGFVGPIRLTTQDCPTSGAYTYGSWGSCSASCGGGTQTREEFCDYDSCYSPQATSRACNTQSCPLTWSYSRSMQTDYCNLSGYGGPTLNNTPSGTCSTQYSSANDYTVHYSIGQCPEPGKETWEYYHMEWDEYMCN